MKRHTPDEVLALGKTIITAHSGCEATAPNSIEHVKAAIAERFGRDVAILDGGAGTARETRRRLLESDLLNDPDRRGGVDIINTAGSPRLIELSEKLIASGLGT